MKKRPKTLNERRGWEYAFHATRVDFLPAIRARGLIPQSHQHVDDGTPVVFVERDVEGLEPYLGEGMTVLRFLTPGFGCTEDGEDVLFAGGPPFVPTDEDPTYGVIPPDQIEVFRGGKWRTLLGEALR